MDANAFDPASKLGQSAIGRQARPPAGQTSVAGLKSPVSIPSINAEVEYGPLAWPANSSHQSSESLTPLAPIGGGIVAALDNGAGICNAPQDNEGAGAPADELQRQAGSTSIGRLRPRFAAVRFAIES